MNDIPDSDENQVRYTTMNHVARLKLGLTPMEYCIYDSIYVLSTNPKAKGWCTASRQYLADFVGITREHVQVIIKKGIDERLLKTPNEKAFYHDNRIKTTQLWYDSVLIMSAQTSISTADSKKILQPIVRKSYDDSKKILHNKDIIKTKDKEKERTLLTQQRKNRRDEADKAFDENIGKMRDIVNGTLKGKAIT